MGFGGDDFGIVEVDVMFLLKLCCTTADLSSCPDSCVIGVLPPWPQQTGQSQQCISDDIFREGCTHFKSSVSSHPSQSKLKYSWIAC